MSSNVPKSPPDSEITPPAVYCNRRMFLKAGAVAAAVAGTALVYRKLNELPPPTSERPVLADLQQSTTADSGYSPQIVKAFRTDEAQTPFQSITHYNNFYEFSTDKEGVAENVDHFSTSGWKITIDGLVSKPGTFDLDDIRKVARPEERVYRMRCVEAWSMVIPWAGYSLS